MYIFIYIYIGSVRPAGDEKENLREGVGRGAGAGARGGYLSM